MTLQGNDNDEEIMKRVRDDIGAEGLHVHVLHTIHVHMNWLHVHVYTYDIHVQYTTFLFMLKVQQ